MSDEESTPKYLSSAIFHIPLEIAGEWNQDRAELLIAKHAFIDTAYVLNWEAPELGAMLCVRCLFPAGNMTINQVEQLVLEALDESDPAKSMIIKKGENLKIEGVDFEITSVHYDGMAVDGNAKVGEADVIKYIKIGIKPDFEGGSFVRMKKEPFMVVECCT